MKNIFHVTKVKKFAISPQPGQSIGRSRSFSDIHGIFYGDGEFNGTYRRTEDRQLLSIREAFDEEDNSPGLMRKSDTIQLPKKDCISPKSDRPNDKTIKEDRNWKFATWSHSTPRNNCRRHSFGGSTHSLDNKSADNGSHVYKNMSIPQVMKFKSQSISRNIIPRRKKTRHSFDCNQNIILETNGEVEGPGVAVLSKTCKDTADNNVSFALQRESLDPDIVETEYGLGFSSNIWYYGEIEIVRGFRRNLRHSTEDFVGTILVRYGQCEDIVYSITYRVGGNLYSGKIPKLRGKYSLDFSDPQEPKFNSVEKLVNFMIEQQYLERVTFDWLLQNVDF